MSEPYTVALVERRHEPGVWVIEAIDEDGGVTQAHFLGRESEARARAYAFVAFGVEGLVPHELTFMHQQPARRRDHLRLVSNQEPGQ